MVSADCDADQQPQPKGSSSSLLAKLEQPGRTGTVAAPAQPPAPATLPSVREPGNAQGANKSKCVQTDHTAWFRCFQLCFLPDCR